MKIFNICNSHGMPAHIKCYNTEKGVEYVREAMMHYGRLLGRAAMSYINNTSLIHIACIADDVDTIARGVAEGTGCKNISFSVYYPSEPFSSVHPIFTSRHQRKGAAETCLLVLPILNQIQFPLAVVKDIAERTEKENITILTPTVVSPAERAINAYMARHKLLARRFDIITLFHDEKRKFAWTAGWLPAVPHDNDNKDCHFLLNVFRNTYKDDLHPPRPGGYEADKKRVRP